MANFATHAVGGAVLGTCGAAAGWLTGDLDLGWSITLGAVTFVSSLAPDLDARASIPARWLWDGLAMLAAAWWIFSVPLVQSSAPRLFIAALSGLLIRGPLSRWVMKKTRHRGLLHTVQAALLVGCGSGYAAFRWGDATAIEQLWLAGAGLVGFLLHLLLDEAFSVDINNARLRRSFGTALKIWDKKSPRLSLGLTVLCGLCVFLFAVGFVR